MPVRKTYRKKPMRRRAGYRKRRMNIPRSVSSLYHAPKRFVSEFKLQDVIASPFGTNPDGYSRNALRIRLYDIPIFTNLWTLYKQFAITSVKLQYRPSINSAVTMSAGGNFTASQILYAEDKDSTAANSPLQIRSQDNCRVLVSTRGFSSYIKKPRPSLYQLDAVGRQLRVITKSKDIYWLSPESSALEDVASSLPHLMAQMCVSDVTGALGDVQQGELWCKVYLSVKEQRKSGALP